METKPCVQCGEEKPVGDFYVDRSRLAGRTSHCKACQLARLPQAACAGGCGGRVFIGPGSLPAGQAMCRSCRRQRRGYEPDRGTCVCVACGREFPFARQAGGGLRPPKKTCSEDCRREASRRRFVQIGRRHRNVEHPCPGCGQATMGHPQARCESCARTLYLERNRRRNMRRRGGRPRTKRMTLTELGDRDGWRCHLCKKRVDRRLKWPDLMSASQDHLIPVADGGSDEPENIALAHWICNSRRGTGGVVQLALVG